MKKTCKFLYSPVNLEIHIQGDNGNISRRERKLESTFTSIKYRVCIIIRIPINLYVPALYEDGEPIEAYPLNRFAEPQKGLPVSPFFSFIKTKLQNSDRHIL